MKKWEELSKEQLEEIFKTYNTYEDIQEQIGYSYRSQRNKEIQQLGETLGFNMEYVTSKKNSNLQGKIFQHLEVLHIDQERSGNGRGIYWACKCLDCNAITYVNTKALKTQINCGCTRRLHLVGQTFNYLTVLEESGVDKYRNITYRCRCKCGKEIVVAGTKLKSGNVQSCGCYHNSEEFFAKQRNDLTGQIFNYLEVIEIDEEKTKTAHKVFWKCKCLNCGNSISVSRNNLIKGQISCGCINSIGEKRINELLLKNHLEYKTQISFDDLKDNGKLRFDFGIYKENNLLCLIEYNGIQHYKAVPFFGGEEQLKIQQKRDMMKINYCEKHNIPLIIFKSLEDIQIEKIYEVINK